MNLTLSAIADTALSMLHPALMWGTLALALYALKLGLNIRKIRSTKGDERRALIKSKPAQKHFIVSSIFMALIVLGTVGGMAVTYINNGKLFVGPHLLAGLGMMSLVALASALSPLMQQGKQWARNLHIALNSGMLAIFAWQALTGMQIVQKILS